MIETHGGCQVLGIIYSRSLECDVFEWKDPECGNDRRGELGMNAPCNLQVKGLKIVEPFNPKRFLLESWPFSAFPAVGSKGLPEPSGPSTHFTDGKTEARGQKSPQRVSAGLGAGALVPRKPWLLLLSALTWRRESSLGGGKKAPVSRNGLNPEKCFRSREEKIF